MIKAGVGSSLSADSKLAGREAALQAMAGGELTKADWGLVFSTFPHRSSYKDILKSVCEVLQTTNVTGCSAIGVLTSLGEIEAEPGVVVLAASSDKLRAAPFLIQDSGDGGLKAGVEIGKHLNFMEGGNALLTLLPDPYLIHPELLFRGVESQLGEIQIVGAAASEHPGMNTTYEFCGDRVLTGAVSGLALYGDFKHGIGITQGCQPVGAPCIITKAEGNIIFELDGEPAFRVLKKRVPKRIIENPMDIMRLLFVGFTPNPNETEIVGRDYLVRNLIGVNPDTEVIGVSENVKEGQIMTFTVRHPTMAREDLKQMLERLASPRQSSRTFKFGFYFNCCARGSSLYGHQGIDTAYITQAFGDIPIIGFFGNSEFAPLGKANHLFTYTGVLVMISE
ncbi:MAG: FIST N-terminal domain-containing protein [Thermodesulfobacteriota bacterium]